MRTHRLNLSAARKIVIGDYRKLHPRNSNIGCSNKGLTHPYVVQGAYLLNCVYLGSENSSDSESDSESSRILVRSQESGGPSEQRGRRNKDTKPPVEVAITGAALSDTTLMHLLANPRCFHCLFPALLFGCTVGCTHIHCEMCRALGAVNSLMRLQCCEHHAEQV